MAQPGTEERNLVPFLYSDPKLLRHKSTQQVLLCNYISNQLEGLLTSNIVDPLPPVADAIQRAPSSSATGKCILKVFSSKTRNVYEHEHKAYDLATGSRDKLKPVVDCLWSGPWTSNFYDQLIDNQLPSIVQPGNTHVHVIMLSYIEDVKHLSSIPPILRQQDAIRAALLALRSLHSLKIVHGDVQEKNILLVPRRAGYKAYWVDLSSSRSNASHRSLSREWNQAIEYFAELVKFSFNEEY
jgi:hypothetical protein